MKGRLKKLYKTKILEVSKSPFNEGELEGYTHKFDAYNPVCGDHFQVYLRIKKEVIENASFTGYGCAISKASTSVLTKHLKGKSRDEARELINSFLELVNSESSQSPESISRDDELLAFASAREFPERLTCANLAWEELRSELWSNQH